MRHVKKFLNFINENLNQTTLTFESPVIAHGSRLSGGELQPVFQEFLNNKDFEFHKNNIQEPLEEYVKTTLFDKPIKFIERGQEYSFVPKTFGHEIGGGGAKYKFDVSFTYDNEFGFLDMMSIKFDAANDSFWLWFGYINRDSFSFRLSDKSVRLSIEFLEKMKVLINKLVSDGFKIEETKLEQNHSKDTIVNYSDLVNNGLRR
jgi:hypothetical protein